MRRIAVIGIVIRHCIFYIRCMPSCLYSLQNAIVAIIHLLRHAAASLIIFIAMTIAVGRVTSFTLCATISLVK